jgi:glutathione peroxidase
MASTLYDIPVRTLAGRDASLAEYAGKVLLIVNVASKCGLTPQYEGLERTFEAERERGLVVLGFPSNQFGAQEPGTSDEIASFCSTNYGVQFPMFEKIDVNGAGRHPLYRALIDAQPGDVQWNFEKFLIARDGRVVARFAPAVTVDDPALRAAIERELEAPAPV